MSKPSSAFGTTYSACSAEVSLNKTAWATNVVFCQSVSESAVCVSSPPEFKTPTRIPRPRATANFSGESPHNDSDFQQDIIWDATSPSPNRLGKLWPSSRDMMQTFKRNVSAEYLFKFIFSGSAAVTTQLIDKFKIFVFLVRGWFLDCLWKKKLFLWMFSVYLFR